MTHRRVELRTDASSLYQRNRNEVVVGIERSHANITEKTMLKRLATLVRLFPLAACLVFFGCIALQSSSISDRSGGSQTVSVWSSDYGILHLTEPEGLTETTNSKLVGQCQVGRVTSVVTELSMREWIIIQWYTVSASGICG